VQPASEGLSVKIMNLLDAAGLDFDVVYVIGMTAGAFPASPRPNPLLPVVWQRTKTGMPRASVEGERELAEAVWARVLASAPEVVVTWPATGESGEENTPSSLVARIEPVAIDSLEGEPWWLGSARRSSAREPRPPENVPPPLVRRGGSSILTNQASCAFRGFLATRLGAEKLPDVRPQPDAARRGTLVHSALVRAYEAVPSADELKGLSEENIRDLARDVARSAVREDPVFFEDAADLEEATAVWLEELVAGWLVYERSVRSDSWTVESMEKEYTLSLPAGVPEPLTIKFRPDRIDRTGNGIAVLDFKTSGTAKKQALWAGDRPDEPQLPLYLTLLELDGARVEAFAFANLAARDASSLEGMATDEIGPACKPPSTRQKSFPPDFHLAVESMRQAIDKLARDYLAGIVTVDPKTPKVCEYCGGRAFCRIVEGGATLEDDAAEEAE
jgi:ATP-dependent helicase/nuclease subunit B